MVYRLPSRGSRASLARTFHPFDQHSFQRSPELFPILTAVPEQLVPFKIKPIPGLLSRINVQTDHESILTERPMFTEQPEQGSMSDIEVNDDGESKTHRIEVIRAFIV